MTKFSRRAQIGLGLHFLGLALLFAAFWWLIVYRVVYFLAFGLMVVGGWLVGDEVSVDAGD